MQTKLTTLAVISISLCLPGCADEPEGEEIPTQTAELGTQSTDALNAETSSGGLDLPDSSKDGTREFEKLRLTIPASWKEAEMTAMQRSVLMAKYTMDGDVEITVSSANGGIDANFSRWNGQFSGDDKDEDSIDFGSATARLLIRTGDFSPGFGRPDRQNWTLLGAAFPDAPTDFYVKLTGPADRVKEIETEFRNVIKTAEFTH